MNIAVSKSVSGGISMTLLTKASHLMFKTNLGSDGRDVSSMNQFKPFQNFGNSCLIIYTIIQEDLI